MKYLQRRWWPVVKALVGLAILLIIARRFSEDLKNPELAQRSIHFGWLTLSALLYLVALGLSGLFWHRLLQDSNTAPPLLVSLRAYWISQLGKYVPGKALALIMRVILVRPLVPPSIAAVLIFVEVLTTMAAGAFVAMLFFVLSCPRADWILPSIEAIRTNPFHPFTLAVFSAGLFAVTFLPLTPAFFNRAVQRVIKQFSTTAVPPIRFTKLLEGLALIAPGWLLMGPSLACAFLAIGVDIPLDLVSMLRLTAILAFAYVIGFVFPLTPAGLGVREYLLAELLGHESVLAVLLLRLSWTVGELIVAGLFFALVPAPREQTSTVEVGS
jgi:hypothetical protein